MNPFKSEIRLQKFINWITKIATLIVSAPATVSVAKRAYADVNGVAQWIVIASCVILVEFSFLYFWVKVDSARANGKDEQLQSGHVLGVWVMFGVLLYAGLLHGEGWGTILFRMSMGLLLFISTRDRLVLTKSKIEEMIANGEYLNRKVIGKQRSADEEVLLERIKEDKKKRLDIIKNDTSGRLQKQAEQDVYAMLDEHEQSIPKVARPKTKRNGEMMENEFYVISQIDDQFQFVCTTCGFSMLKPSRKIAALAGNSHQKVHSHGKGSNHNGHKQTNVALVLDK